MAIHPRDKGTNNPRLQCSVCGRWKRLHTKRLGRAAQIFYGGCEYSSGGDHLAGDHVDVCDDCCRVQCKKLGGE